MRQYRLTLRRRSVVPQFSENSTHPVFRKTNNMGPTYAHCCLSLFILLIPVSEVLGTHETNTSCVTDMI